jgi:uncharacterized protein YbjT (DUF2867 family)
MEVLVTGATGYIGGRLVPRLLAEGHSVRALTRSAGRLRDVPWADSVRVVEGDVLGGEGLQSALAGVDVAYYLVHSIGEGRSSRRSTGERPEPSPTQPVPQEWAGWSTWAGSARRPSSCHRT